jgi:hypothetical protein
MVAGLGEMVVVIEDIFVWSFWQGFPMDHCWLVTLPCFGWDGSKRFQDLGERLYVL